MKIEEQKYFGEAVKEKNLEDFFVSLTTYLPNTKIEEHFHEKPYLCFLVNGLYQEKSTRKTTIIKTGNTLFRSANHQHSNDFSNHTGICLNIEINNPEKYTNQNDFKIPVSEYQRRGSIDVFKLLHGIKQNKAKDLLNIYCYEAMSSHFDNIPTKGILKWVTVVKEQIKDDPFTNISLPKLSQEFQIHPNYIVRKFKEVTGYKLSDYLNRTRIESSLNRILTSDENLTKVAYNTGFYDQSHYNKNFIKHFGVSPKEFRKVIKG